MELINLIFMKPRVHTLEDLDGNQVVKGSAGSVGQGGSETLDELLSYKSLNIRQFINRYKDSENFYDGNGWGETYTPFKSKRTCHKFGFRVRFI